MLLKPICLNYKHEIALRVYLDMITTTIKDITQDESKYNNFLDVANIIIDHHNNYKSDVLGVANYQDFLSLIPNLQRSADIQYSVLNVSAFLNTTVC